MENSSINPDLQNADFLGLIGKKGDGWEIIGCEGQGSTDYWPAVNEQGEEVPYWDCPSVDYYFAHKVRKSRLTIRYIVAGNPIMAEDWIQEQLGCNAMSAAPHTVDVYYATDKPE